MKRVLVGLTSVGMLALVAAPVLAGNGGGHNPPMPQDPSDVVVNNGNFASGVYNNVAVIADTGNNSISGGSDNHMPPRGGCGMPGGNDMSVIMTGDASAYAFAGNYVNDNSTTVNAPCEDCDGDVTVNNGNFASGIGNNALVVANTGDNTIGGGKKGPMGPPQMHGGSDGSGLIWTGDASAGAELVNVVNSNVTRITR